MGEVQTKDIFRCKSMSVVPHQFRTWLQTDLLALDFPVNFHDEIKYGVLFKSVILNFVYIQYIVNYIISDKYKNLRIICMILDLTFLLQTIETLRGTIYYCHIGIILWAPRHFFNNISIYLIPYKILLKHQTIEQIVHRSMSMNRTNA